MCVRGRAVHMFVHVLCCLFVVDLYCFAVVDVQMCAPGQTVQRGVFESRLAGLTGCRNATRYTIVATTNIVICSY